MYTIKFLSPIRYKTLDYRINNNDTISQVECTDKDDAMVLVSKALESLYLLYKTTTDNEERDIIKTEYKVLSDSYKELKASELADKMSITFTSLKKSLSELKDTVLKMKDKKYKSNSFLVKDSKGNWYQDFD